MTSEEITKKLHKLTLPKDHDEVMTLIPIGTVFMFRNIRCCVIDPEKGVTSYPKYRKKRISLVSTSKW